MPKISPLFYTGLFSLILLTGCGGGRDGNSAPESAAGHPPTLSVESLTPASGPPAGGTVVTLRGVGFDAQTAVLLDGVAAETEFMNTQLLRVTAPPHPSGTVDVQVVTGGGNEVTAADAFEYLPSPAAGADFDADGLSDAAEAGGWDVRVDDSGFGVGSPRRVTSKSTQIDADGDGLSDLDEYTQRTDPNKADTDGDWLSDADEVRRWRTSPISVDTDADARGPQRNLPPAVALFDGAELRLDARSAPAADATSPTLDDTDGDARTDFEEIVTLGRSPVIADLPRLKVDLVDKIDVRLNVQYAENEGRSTSYGVTTTTTNSTANTNEDAGKVGLAIGWKAKSSIGTFGFGGEHEFSVGISGEYSHRTATTTTDSFATANSSLRVNSRNLTETVSTGSLSAGVRLSNVGAIAYTVSDLAYTVRIWVPDPNNSYGDGDFQTLATLRPPLGASGISLAPGASTPVIQVQAENVNASRVREYLARPDAIYVEPAYFEFKNAQGLNYAYITENTFARTALINVDFADGRAESQRVAVSVGRDAGGNPTGATLGRILGDVLHIPFETQPRRTLEPSAPGNERVLVKLRDTVGTDPRRAKWIVVVNDTELGKDFEEVIVRPGDYIVLSLSKDGDGDGLFLAEEEHYGTSDFATDTDGDGLSDREEARGERLDDTACATPPCLLPAGWIAGPRMGGVNGYPRRVVSHPRYPDTDGDGLSDRAEMLGNDGLPPEDPYDSGDATDPTTSDTDGDGLHDGVDPFPVVPARPLFVRVGAAGAGLDWTGAYPDLNAAFTDASARNGNADPSDDISEIWIAQGDYPVPPDGLVLPSNVHLYGGFAGREWKIGQRNQDPLSNGTTINGAGRGTTLIVATNPGTATTLDGLTLTGVGGLANGGAVRQSGGTLTIRNVFFLSNRARAGGAIYVGDGGRIDIADSVFSDNRARDFGGAISLNNGSFAAIRRSTFQGNLADGNAGPNVCGGAIYAGFTDSLDVADSRFLLNKATVYGGAVCLNQIGSFDRVRFDQNWAGSRGGAIYLYAVGNNSVDILNSVFWDNTTNMGGAISVDGVGRVSIGSTTIVSNTSLVPVSGGGIDARPSASGSPAVRLQNSIVAFNRNGETLAGGDNGGSQLYLSGDYSVQFSNVFPPNYLGLGSIGGNPMFVEGETGNLNLSATSPAIDLGNNFANYGNANTGFVPIGPVDFAGAPRSADGNGDGVLTIDMGAYEFVP